LHMDTNRVLNTRTEITNLLAETNYVYMEFHSEGGIVGRNAISALSKEDRARLIITGFAVAAYMDVESALKIKYFRSQRDIVPFCDMIGLVRSWELIEVLNPHKEAPLFDHPIASPTYRNHQKNSAKAALKEYGGYT